MKIFNYLFIAAFLFISGQMIAQEKVAYIKYAITDIHSDEPAIMQQAGMLKNGYMEQYTLGNKSMTVTNSAGMFITKTLFNKDTKESTMYMDVMGQKIKVPMSADERDEMQDDDIDIKVEVLKDETKEILGYKAYKTLLKITSEDGKTTIELWVTEQLKSDAGDFSNMLQVGTDNFEINGVPLEFVIDANGMMQMTYTAQAVKTQGDVDASVFDIDDAGYKVMTLDEFQSSMGGMF